MEKFEFTAEGYQLAKAWLIETDQWEYTSTHGFSVDGYSLVETANVLWKEYNK
jgi:hypothetical protein